MTLIDRQRDERDLAAQDTIFAERLRAIMGARRMTLRALANVCGVTPQAVKKWRDGTSMPSSRQFLAICEACDCSCEWLFARTALDWQSSEDAPQGRHAKYWVREAIAELREIGFFEAPQ